MDNALTAILENARRVGVRIRLIRGEVEVDASGDRFSIPEHWHEKLRPHKAELLKVLATEDQPAEAVLWPEPKPLPDILPPVAPFDAKMLPDAVRPFIEDVTQRMQCPIDFPAVAMMIVLAGALARISHSTARTRPPDLP